MRKSLRSIIALWLTLLVAPVALAQTNPSNPSSIAPSEPAKPPPSSSSSSSSSSAAAVSAPSGYVLSANDSISVEVFGEDDLKTAARLNAEGNVSLPLIGSVRLGGLTLTQATARVTELYAKDYLVHPKVNVTLLGYAKRRFIVLGQVNHPGNFEMPETSPGGIDLLEAIAMAGGYTRIAAPERISVRRNTGHGDQVMKVDGKKLARGEGGGFKVLSGDTITVGESIF
ncbi:MAG: polysaccharide biosynthesis/export protein [Verrucomicrobiota bacterium]|jgi:polysaccharide export outer membrane protein